MVRRFNKLTNILKKIYFGIEVITLTASALIFHRII